MPLAEIDRGRLDGIVSQMQSNGESDDDIQHVVGDFKTKYDADSPSMAGSFGRGALRSAAPTLAGGFLGGAASSAAAGLEFGPVGVAVAGLGGGVLGMIGASEAQKKLATAINPSESNPFSEASELRDVQTNPFMSEAGGMLLFKPNPANVLRALRGVGTAEGRQLVAKGYQLQKAIQSAPAEARAAMVAEPEAQKALDAFHQTVNVAGNTGVGAGMAIAQGQDPEHILLAAAQGSLFNDSWLHGKGGHPLNNPKEAEVHAEMDKVAKADADLTAKSIDAAEIINKGAENPLTSKAAEAAAEVLNEKLPQEEAKQTSEITDALKPLAEDTPIEVPYSGNVLNASEDGMLRELEAIAKREDNGPLSSDEIIRARELHKELSRRENPNVIPYEESETFTAPEAEVIQPTEEPSHAPENQVEETGRATPVEEQPVVPEPEGQAEAGTPQPQGQGEKIVAATFTDENGQVHEGANHIEAAQKAGVEAPNSRKGRETPEYGFKVEDGQGNSRVVSRQEGLALAQQNSQLKKGTKIARGRLHSDQVHMGEIPQEPIPEPPSTSKVTDYNKRGNLASEKELPHEEAVKLLEPRKNALDLLVDCLNK